MHDPGEGTNFYLTQLLTNTPVDEIPGQRLSEVHRTVASLEFEPA